MLALAHAGTVNATRVVSDTGVVCIGRLASRNRNLHTS